MITAVVDIIAFDVADQDGPGQVSADAAVVDLHRFSPIIGISRTIPHVSVEPISNMCCNLGYTITCGFKAVTGIECRRAKECLRDARQNSAHG